MKLNPITANQTEVIAPSGWVIFFSYSTPVAACDPDGNPYRTETKHSVTTSKHIRKWLKPKCAAAEYRPQSWFDSLPDNVK